MDEWKSFFAKEVLATKKTKRPWVLLSTTANVLPVFSANFQGFADGGNLPCWSLGATVPTTLFLLNLDARIAIVYDKCELHGETQDEAERVVLLLDLCHSCGYTDICLLGVTNPPTRQGPRTSRVGSETKTHSSAASVTSQVTC